MSIISSRDLGGLPDLQDFRRLTRSLAMLDAILSREWEDRYYSFDAHEAPMYRPDEPRPGLFIGLPPKLSGFCDEPFCIWRRTSAEAWERGPVQFLPGDDPDGSAELLQHLDGRPETYVSFAAEYHGVEVPLDAVTGVYRHTPLTTELVARLNPAVLRTDLASDLAEIGYPDTRP